MDRDSTSGAIVTTTRAVELAFSAAMHAIRGGRYAEASCHAHVLALKLDDLGALVASEAASEWDVLFPIRLGALGRAS